MKKISCKWGFTQIIKVILSLTQDLRRLSLPLVNSMRGRSRIKYGMTSLFNHGGFTLIELLVVVLIIGILAAVAVPQYQKAIWKSRLAQWDVAFDAGRKAIDAYLLENGWPEKGTVYLTGKNGAGAVEIPGNCDIDNRCYTSAGAVMVYCTSSRCEVKLYGHYNADGTLGNNALGDDDPKAFYRRTKGSSYMSSITGKAGCLWASTHSDITVASSYITACKNTYGVTLPTPEYVEE